MKENSLLGIAIWLAACAGYLSLSHSIQIPSSTKVDKAKRSKLLVVTRLHGQQAVTLPPPEKLVSFVEGCKAYTQDILVCIGLRGKGVEALREYELAVEPFAPACRVTFLPIEPWGYYTTALNHALLYAQDHDFDLVAFQSLEYQATAELTSCLIGHFDEDTLVVGAAMTGHLFQEGVHTLSGRRCPWNTMAIWRVDYLSLVGFLLISDGLANDRAIGGVEELASISLLQQLRPSLKAKLVAQAGSEEAWKTTFDDPERAKYQEFKMQSKEQRAARQLQTLPLTAGHVIHLRSAQN
eukprot:gene7006-7749_t